MRIRVVVAITALFCAISLQPAQANNHTTTEITPPCSATVKKSVLATIIGQTQYLGKRDFKSAFTFSSVDFRKGISLPMFTSIITTNYGYLIGAKQIQITECLVIGGAPHMQVNLKDKSGTPFSMFYVLQKQSKKQLIAPNKTGYGISGAEIVDEAPQESF
jgi:hypothetical protein